MKLETELERTAKLMDFASACARLQKSEPLIQLITERVKLLFDFERFTIMLCDKERQNLRIMVVGEDVAKEIPLDAVPISDMGTLIESLLNGTVSADDKTICEPMLSAGRTIGVLCLRAEYEQFSELDRRILHFLAEYLAGTFERLVSTDTTGGVPSSQPTVMEIAELGILQTPDVLRHISYLAQHDNLTHLPNRELLNERLTRTLTLSRRYGRRFALLFLDLDRFKTINDTYGHCVGDEVLRQISDRMVACVRSSDTVSRIGGDEFVILLSELKDEKDATLCAGNIMSAVSAPLRISGRELHLTVSIGISIYPADGEDEETLINAADTAMYKAKRGWQRNRRQVRKPPVFATAMANRPC